MSRGPRRKCTNREMFGGHAWQNSLQGLLCGATKMSVHTRLAMLGYGRMRRSGNSGQTAGQAPISPPPTRLQPPGVRRATLNYFTSSWPWTIRVHWPCAVHQKINITLQQNQSAAPCRGDIVNVQSSHGSAGLPAYDDFTWRCALPVLSERCNLTAKAVDGLTSRAAVFPLSREA